MSEAKGGGRRSAVLPVTPEQEQNYHRAMARLMAERGYLTLSEAHLAASRDCPAGCGCEGCSRTKMMAREIREQRDARKAAGSRQAVSA